MRRPCIREFAERADEPTVNPVLPAPHQPPTQHPSVTRCHCVPVAGADQAQKCALRPERRRILPAQRPTQIALQRLRRPDREHTRLRAGVINHGGDIADGIDLGVRDRLERLGDSNESPLIQRKTSMSEPCWCACARRPQDRLQRELTAARHRQSARTDSGHRPAGQHLDPPPRQHALKCPSHARGMHRQNLRRIGEQEVLQLIGTVARGAQQTAQTVLDREQHFDARGARADHADA